MDPFSNIFGSERGSVAVGISPLFSSNKAMSLKEQLVLKKMLDSGNTQVVVDVLESAPRQIAGNPLAGELLDALVKRMFEINPLSEVVLGERSICLKLSRMLWMSGRVTVLDKSEIHVLKTTTVSEDGATHQATMCSKTYSYEQRTPVDKRPLRHTPGNSWYFLGGNVCVDCQKELENDKAVNSLGDQHFRLIDDSTQPLLQDKTLQYCKEFFSLVLIDGTQQITNRNFGFMRENAYIKALGDIWTLRAEEDYEAMLVHMSSASRAVISQIKKASKRDLLLDKSLFEKRLRSVFTQEDFTDIMLATLKEYRSKERKVGSGRAFTGKVSPLTHASDMWPVLVLERMQENWDKIWQAEQAAAKIS